MAQLRGSGDVRREHRLLTPAILAAASDRGSVMDADPKLAKIPESIGIVAVSESSQSEIPCRCADYKRSDRHALDAITARAIYVADTPP